MALAGGIFSLDFTRPLPSHKLRDQYPEYPLTNDQ